MSYPRNAVNEAFKLLPPKMDTRASRILHAAIGYQETKYLTRAQYGGGPARSYWQFERQTVKAVMLHAHSARLAIAVCEARNVEFNSQKIWEAMATDDVLGAAFARLLMWTDSQPLPTTEADAWEMYAERVWRPGKPHPKEWPASWAFGLANA